MRQQVARVGVLQTALVVAVFYLVVSVLALVLGWSLIGSVLNSWAIAFLPFGALIVLSLINGVLCFLITMLLAWVYNLVACRIGGIEFTTVEIARPSSPGQQ